MSGMSRVMPTVMGPSSKFKCCLRVLEHNLKFGGMFCWKLEKILTSAEPLDCAESVKIISLFIHGDTVTWLHLQEVWCCSITLLVPWNNTLDMWFPSRLQDSSDDRIQERGDGCVRVYVCVCVHCGGVFMQKIWPSQKQPFVLTHVFPGSWTHHKQPQPTQIWVKALKELIKYTTHLLYLNIWNYKYWNLK